MTAWAVWLCALTVSPYNICMSGKHHSKHSFMVKLTCPGETCLDSLQD